MPGSENDKFFRSTLLAPQALLLIGIILLTFLCDYWANNTQPEIMTERATSVISKGGPFILFMMPYFLIFVMRDRLFNLLEKLAERLNLLRRKRSPSDRLYRLDRKDMREQTFAFRAFRRILEELESYFQKASSLLLRPLFLSLSSLRAWLNSLYPSHAKKKRIDNKQSHIVAENYLKDLSRPLALGTFGLFLLFFRAIANNSNTEAAVIGTVIATLCFHIALTKYRVSRGVFGSNDQEALELIEYIIEKTKRDGVPPGSKVSNPLRHRVTETSPESEAIGVKT
ncbi:hypothetical protein [Bradyrhizobium sp. SZCCHNS3002]|uniref:hypothetical protein n=1 Tax=Bradyrhizobium sp. SZCCHNS3002 TaxID=3057310 RepID=UPI0028E30687|nr:hypothetical protein [Bradyrhizobium sp. SZCCHNS3002]